ncbi:MAG: hypothetical protein IKL40_06105, partial [Clostridia bacterium]|nr:hypothetical protein [Clostridia bacterium]
MSENRDNLLVKLNINNRDSNYLWKIVTILSLVVILIVFWSLKLTGIGVAGEAFCGKPEHVHKESCSDEANPCRIEEHIHTENCYSDIKADIETSDDWEDSLADLVRGPTIKDNVVLVARSQIGYTESE